MDWHNLGFLPHFRSCLPPSLSFPSPMMSSIAARNTLVSVWSYLLTAKYRRLTKDERSLLKRYCAEFFEGVYHRPICNHAMREFAEEIFASSLILDGQLPAADLEAIVQKAESLKFLIG